MLPLPTILYFLDELSFVSMPSGLRLVTLQCSNAVKGQPHLLHYSDIDYLKHLIRHCPEWFLDELLYLLQTN